MPIGAAFDGQQELLDNYPQLCHLPEAKHVIHGFSQVSAVPDDHQSTLLIKPVFTDLLPFLSHYPMTYWYFQGSSAKKTTNPCLSMHFGENPN